MAIAIFTEHGATRLAMYAGPRRLICRLRALVAACGLMALAASAQTFNVVYTFSDTDSVGDGANPSGMILASNGDFYVTTVNNGSNDWGALCQISPSSAMKPVYSFNYGSPTNGGYTPYAALVQGTNGLFYGMAQTGGVSSGSGTVFDVSSNGTFALLYDFPAEKGSKATNSSGGDPSYALVRGTNGSFYGTTESGGTNGYGTVFEITPAGAITVFYSFSNDADGAVPMAPLLQFTNGALYGTASAGGSNGDGTVFQVTAAGKVTPIYSFTNGVDGSAPEAALINGNDGELYGTCIAGGSNGTGTIFKITTNGLLTALYSFDAGTNFPETSGIRSQYNPNGISPKAILLGSDNNIYGVAFYGGSNGSGSVFQCSRSGALTVLYAFTYSSGNPNDDGASPISLIQAPDGTLYGAGYTGGSNANGTIFSIGLPPSITAQPSNQAVALHANASFTVVAANALGCQWQFGASNLLGATNYTLSITNVQPAQAGYYAAVLTNLNGSVTSSVVTLTITNVAVSFLTGAGAIQYSGGQLTLELTNLTGQGAVVIESSSNLLQWTPVFTNPSGFGTAQFIDTTAGSYPNRYYRAWTP